MKSNVTAREEEARRFPGRYIDSIKSQDGRELWSNREMRDAFRAHFRDRFACYPDLELQEFLDYLDDFPRLREAEASSCKSVVPECEVRDALKPVGHNKSPGLAGLRYEVYLKLPHVCAYSDEYFQPLVCPGVTKGVIILLVGMFGMD